MTASAWNPNNGLVPTVDSKNTIIPEYQLATAGQRTFNLKNFAYAVNSGALAVFKNGKILTKNKDYIEATNTQVLLTAGAYDKDELYFVGFVAISSTATVDAQLRADLQGAAGATVVFAGNDSVGAVLDTIQLVNYAALRAYNGGRQKVSITGYMAAATPSGTVGTFVVDPSDNVSADNNGTIIVDALGRRWKRQYNGVADVRWFLEGVTHTVGLQAAVNAEAVVIVPTSVTLNSDTISLQSNKKLIVDGTVKRIANAASDSYLFVNAGGAAGNYNIRIMGDGVLDGNSANQGASDRQGLIKFQAPSDCVVNIRQAGGNKYTSPNATTTGQGCIVYTDAIRSHITVRFLNLWQREGILIDGASKHCSIRDVTALGDGQNSWSATSISGVNAAYNKILNINAENCGATSVVLDSTYSQADQIISLNNQFNNGVNFGHTGKPATKSKGSNITVINAGQGATSGSTHCGVQVGGGTTDFELSNVTVDGAYNHCIQISDGSSKVQLKGANRLTGALHGCGINVFGADKTRISGVVAYSNSDYGVNLNASNDCFVSDCDLRGNTIAGFSATGSRCAIVGTPCSDDPIAISVNLVASGALAAGGTVTVANGNINGFYSKINVLCRDSAGQAAGPIISSRGTGTLTLQVTNALSSVGAPHNVSLEII